jgi:hypothetical protein
MCLYTVIELNEWNMRFKKDVMRRDTDYDSSGPEFKKCGQQKSTLWLPMFRKNIPPSPSGWRLYVPQKSWYLSTCPHGVRTQSNNNTDNMTMRT